MDEVVAFLGDAKPEVRKLAVQAVLSQTDSEEGMAALAQHRAELLPALIRLLADTPTLADDAFKCLVNLSDDTDWSSDLATRFGLATAICEHALDRESRLLEISCMLLSNLSRNPGFCRQLLQLERDVTLRYRNFRHLIAALLAPPPADPSARGGGAPQPDYDPYKWIATVAMNATQLPEGRKFFLDPDIPLLSRMVEQVSHANYIRRGGAIGVVRNCAMEASQHADLIRSDNILAPLVDRLIVPGGDYTADERAMCLSVKPCWDHTAEDDSPVGSPPESVPELRKMILETFVALASSRACREHLRDRQLYCVVRELNLVEQDEDVNTACIALVDLLVRNEAGDDASGAKGDAPTGAEPAAGSDVAAGLEKVSLQAPTDDGMEEMD